MSTDLLQENKDILGYQLKKRIGSGGFGEVWSAIAPGGLQKAIKIVYGYHDDRKAQAELKALDRAKELRHPFLLMLERIDIFEDKLIVVMELAEKSLAEVFNEYQARGEPGIPRDMLLKYIRTSSDALDYLSEVHGMQHLDIKPENLMLVGGHLKVADFGLIKQLNDVTQSLMTGMTPAYAAPEVFDGRPGKYSDQYSLAIVYQEMLTGLRPFAGTTPAQLAAQHLHGKPNLQPLPKSDQATIAKALAKEPSLRFPNCVTMAEELNNIKRATRTTIRRLQPTERSNSDTEGKTSDWSDSSATAVASSNALPFRAKEIKVLDPPEGIATKATVRPVFIIGVGATANRAVSLLKRQLIARHGALAKIPSIRLLCIDTDRNEVTRLCMANDDSALSNDETFAIPLMKPEDYRERADTRLTWLSRRWIFNIPRSLQTEGLRPLGRLAFVEHFEPLCDKLETVLRQGNTIESLARTADTLEIDPGELKPQVYVLSSISGGVGSGIVLDLAYTIRLLLSEQGFDAEECEMIGLLFHSTYQRTRDAGLAAANTFAFFTELRHFVENGYPGDKSIGMPDFGDIAPFDHSYYFELGNNLSQTDLDKQLEGIGDYIYLSSISRCEPFFTACRKIEFDQTHFSLRTFGISTSGPENVESRLFLTHKIAFNLVQEWVKGGPGQQIDIQAELSGIDFKFQIEAESIASRISELTDCLFEGRLNSLLESAAKIGLSPAEDPILNMNSCLDGIFGEKGEAYYRPRETDPEACHSLEEQLSAIASEMGSKLVEQIKRHLNGTTIRLVIAQGLNKEWHNRIENTRLSILETQKQCLMSLKLIQTTLASLLRPNQQFSKTDLEKRERLLEQFCHLRYQEFLIRFSRRFLELFSSSLDGIRSLVGHFESSLNQLTRQLKGLLDSDHVILNSGKASIEQLLIRSIEKDLPNHLVQSETQLLESFIRPSGGFIEIFNQSSVLNRRLPVEICNAAQLVLANAFQKVSLEQVIEDFGVGMEQVVKWTDEQMRLAQPKVQDCGGASRVMIGLPALTDYSILPEFVKRQFDLNSVAVKGTSGSYSFCFEAEELPLASVAFRLLQLRPDAVELVKRIHTRTDIAWSSLNELF